MINKGTPIVIFSSFGNDSCALIEWCRQKQIKDVWVAYSNTGWWDDRVDNLSNYIKQMGYNYTEIPSEGFKSMVRRKKGFPRNGIQFCTGELKIAPAMKWLEEIDPDKKRVVMVGVRREESVARRDFPEWVEESFSHGGRSCYAPLVEHKEKDVAALLHDFGIEPLPHRSMECYPCINAKKDDLKLLTEERIAEIEEFEKELGFTSKGKPRTMFRPYRHMGATGIREVCKWANSPRGKYGKGKNQFDLFIDNEEQSGCENGWCGI